MKTTTLIALLAVVSAVSVGAISMNTNPSFALATGAISPEAGTMMGHVEYVVRDSTGAIKSYQQLDNMVVNQGDNCVITAAFQTSNAGGTDVGCTFSADGFRFIGIGNATHTPTATSTTLVDGGATTVASSGTPGIMAVKGDTNTVGTASSDGGTVVISTSTATGGAGPFTFGSSTVTNATTVRTAGLFDAQCSGVGGSNSGICTTNAATMNMFAAQAISVAVTAGDSLDVTWTITVGNAS